MIITRLIGGLGNQMFQYAVGRRLAHYHNTGLFLDITGFALDALRKYDLEIFRINASIASSEMLKQVPFSQKDRINIRIRNLFSRKTVFQYIKERKFEFNKQILHLPDNVYLDGYWQSEKYFKNIEEIIRNEFRINVFPDPLNKKVGENITSHDSVSVHFRRGDYMTNPVANQVLGLCDLDYYKKAVEEICQRLDKPIFFIFSDDPMWTKNNIKFNYPTVFISHNNAEKNYEDLRLMSMCRHHIIANSSFSWWGAWLDPNPDKIVYAPKKWFDQSILETKDLIPNSWIRL